MEQQGWGEEASSRPSLSIGAALPVLLESVVGSVREHAPDKFAREELRLTQKGDVEWSSTHYETQQGRATCQQSRAGTLERVARQRPDVAERVPRASSRALRRRASASRSGVSRLTPEPAAPASRLGLGRVSQESSLATGSVVTGPGPSRKYPGKFNAYHDLAVRAKVTPPPHTPQKARRSSPRSSARPRATRAAAPTPPCRGTPRPDSLGRRASPVVRRPPRPSNIRTTPTARTRSREIKRGPLPHNRPSDVVEPAAHLIFERARGRRRAARGTAFAAAAAHDRKVFFGTVHSQRVARRVLAVDGVPPSLYSS